VVNILVDCIIIKVDNYFVEHSFFLVINYLWLWVPGV